MRKSTILLLICVALVVTFVVKVSLSQSSTVSDPNQIPSKEEVKLSAKQLVMLGKIDAEVKNGQMKVNYSDAKRIAETHGIEYTQKHFVSIILNKICSMVGAGASFGNVSTIARSHGIEYTFAEFIDCLPTSKRLAYQRAVLENSEKAKQLKSKINDLDSKYSATLDSRVDDLESKINDLDSKYSDLDSKYSDLDSKYSDLDSKYNRLANRVNDLERKISTLELSR